jgi:hypothetical protein
MEKTNAFVFKHTDGKAMKTAVKIGFNDGTNVEVPELKADDVLLGAGNDSAHRQTGCDGETMTKPE